MSLQLDVLVQEINDNVKESVRAQYERTLQECVLLVFAIVTGAMSGIAIALEVVK